MGQKRLHLIVRGRVQGVYFRASAQREAKLLGLTGWAKNRHDNSVEVVVEGEEDQVKDFLAWAQHGPATGGSVALVVHHGVVSESSEYEHSDTQVQLETERRCCAATAAARQAARSARIHIRAA